MPNPGYTLEQALQNYTVEPNSGYLGRTGDKHPMFRKYHSEESKTKISLSLLGKLKTRSENARLSIQNEAV